MKKISKTILSISEARKKIFEISKKIQKPGVHYIFTENGKAKMVAMSAEEFDSLMEDIEILSNPKTMANIKQAEEEIERGEYVTLDELKEELGYKNNLQPAFVAEKPKKPYGAKIKKVNNHGKK